ncbi:OLIGOPEPTIDE TRANSPORTER-RELATED [Salix koriyanagi]|uniref:OLIGOPEPTIDE TRANSPORTER-RELATED n=1 Tax=Salix koriyanagi TaxID=2511006 RepID=A0A9Q1ABN6_9ROSI|nr:OLIGOPEPTIDE TRANSPORTER-RELATED [Salix koriyanagi]
MLTPCSFLQIWSALRTGNHHPAIIRQKKATLYTASQCCKHNKERKFSGPRMMEQPADEHRENYRGVRAMPFVMGNETFEKLGSTGTLSNLLVYLTTVFHMKTITATTLVNIFNGTTNIATLAGAFLCDTYFGRYRTLAFASVASFLGMVAIALTAAISKLQPPQCAGGKQDTCPAVTPWQMTFLLCGLGLLVIGGGGIRPLVVYVQSDISWAWGLAIPAFLMFCSCVLFFAGSRIYVKVQPDGSPLTSVVQPVPSTPTFPILISSDFLDKAAILTTDDQIMSNGASATPWRLCSLQQVEEVKCLLRVIPIWASALLYYISLIQQQTFAVFQALQSNRRLGNTNFKIPAASYAIFSMLGLTIWLPIYDRLIVPWLAKYTRKEAGITILQKMGAGMALGVATTLVSGMVEGRRRELAARSPAGVDPRSKVSISSLSAFWLVPQLTLAGISEAFTVIAQIELYYKQFPENMRSIGGSLSFVSVAASSYLSGLLISMVHQVTKNSACGDWLAEDLNNGRLDLFYYLVATLGVINMGYFAVCARWYKYKGNGGAATPHETGENLLFKTI